MEFSFEIGDRVHFEHVPKRGDGKTHVITGTVLLVNPYHAMVEADANDIYVGIWSVRTEKLRPLAATAQSIQNLDKESDEMNNITVGSEEYRKTLHRWSKLHGLHTHLNVLTPTEKREMEQLNDALQAAELQHSMAQAGSTA